MDGYLLVKTIQILSATALFGTGLGIAFFFLRGLRGSDVGIQGTGEFRGQHTKSGSDEVTRWIPPFVQDTHDFDRLVADPIVHEVMPAAHASQPETGWLVHRKPVEELGEPGDVGPERRDIGSRLLAAPALDGVVGSLVEVGLGLRPKQDFNHRRPGRISAP